MSLNSTQFIRMDEGKKFFSPEVVKNLLAKLDQREFDAYRESLIEFHAYRKALLERLTK